MRVNDYHLKTCFIIVLVIFKSLIPVVNAQPSEYETSGSKNYLPVFYKNLAAEFLSRQPEVYPGRIAAMGLSLGGFRTWQVAALSDHISAGVSICWMSTYKGLMVPGNNQTKGQPAYTMIHLMNSTSACRKIPSIGLTDCLNEE